MKNIIKINIIGCGSTGVSFLSQILERIISISSKEKYEINIFDSNKSPGVGLAYNSKSHCLILNSPAEMFSIYSDDPEDFFKWLKQYPDKWRHKFPEVLEIKKSSFLPRKLAGLYLMDKFEQACRLANKNGIIINFIQDEVNNIIENNFQTEILTKSGKKYVSNFIILCTGNIDSTDCFGLKGNKKYFNSTYLEEEDRIKNNIDPFSSVLILGTRLSGIDAVVLLNENNHRGKITISSRKGIIPAVRTELRRYPLKYLTLDNIKKQIEKHNSILNVEHLLDLVEKEVSYIYNRNIKKSDILRYHKDPKIGLKIDLYNAKKRKVYWEKIQVEFFDLIEEYWKVFPDTERIRYMKEFIGIMQRYTSSFPVVNAEKLLKLMDSGQLSVESGIENIEYDNNRCCFNATFNKINKFYIKSYDYVINATGPSKDLKKSKIELYINLINNKIIQLNCLGGLNVNTENYSLIMNKKFNAKIYAAGPPTFGSSFFTNFVITSAKQAEAIVKDIIGHLVLFKK